jgi:hypothetical protein
MPHSTLKLLPGVDQNRTLALNEAAISETQFVRFVPDKQGLGLVQKLGGWLKYFPSKLGSIVRALWAWEDTNGDQYLGLGAQNRITTVSSVSRSVVSNVVTVTLTFPSGVVFNVGDTITVSGLSPDGYNGTYQVSAATTTTVSYTWPPSEVSNATWLLNTATLTITNGSAFTVGDTITVYSVSPGGYNGNYTVTASTTTSVSYTVTPDPGAYVSDGSVVLTSAISVTDGVLYAGDSLSVISDGVRSIISPRSETYDVAVKCRTQSGSPYVIIQVDGSEINNTDTVYIKTQISVGGLILFGLYPTTFIDGANLFQITALDSLGQEVLATSTVALPPGGGAVPNFDFTDGSALVTVTLADHGFGVGDTFTIVVPVTAAGVTLYGNYTVNNVISTSQFKISGENSATATTSVFMNGGEARYEFYKTPGAVPASLGYGVGGYGVGGYGTGVVPISGNSGNPVIATDWTIDNWGQILVAGNVNGPIFTWDPLSGISRASIITNAPPVNDGVFVAMPQQQIIAWGSTFTGIKDPLLIRWSEVGDYDTWIALPTNQAGSYRMPKGSRIVGCIQGPQQGLVWTDLALWAMQYVGPPFVYQFNEIGTGCGLISRKAATSLNGTIYWMGQSQFFKMAGNGVEMVTCPVWDVIFQDLDTTNLDNIRIAANSYFGEVTWYYPTISGNGEPTKYVKYNSVINQWDFGTLTRTAWINQSVLGAPIGAGPTIPADEEVYVYQHETSPDADGNAMVASFQTGYYQLSDAEWKVFVDQIWPDMKWGYYDGLQDADLTITFYVTDYPGETPRTYGPYAINSQTTYITPRFRGRLMSIKMESSDLGSFWRIGATRYRYQQDGKF